MKYYRYAVRVERVVEGVGGRRWHQTTIGQSNISHEDAQAQGEQILANLPTPEQSYLKHKRGEAEYTQYGERPIVEELLKELADDSNRVVGVLTRNHYGCVVLNTEQVAFFDVDHPSETSTSPGLLKQVFSWFGGKSNQVSPNHAHLARLLRNLERYPNHTFRVYETAAGFRVMLLSQTLSPKEKLAQDLFFDLECDPLYYRLCHVQECFRARLTAKPWRMGLRNPGSVYPRSSQWAQQSFSVWLDLYETRLQQYAVCRYVQDVGPVLSEHALPTAVQATLAVHDAFTLREKKEPLA